MGFWPLGYGHNYTCYASLARTAFEEWNRNSARFGPEFTRNLQDGGVLNSQRISEWIISTPFYALPLPIGHYYR